MDWSIIKEFFRETSLDIISLLFLLGVFYVMFSLLRIMFYERKIEKLEKRKEAEIESIKGRPGQSLSFMEGSVKNVEQKYQPKIEKFKRKRRYILDRLPFFKN